RPALVRAWLTRATKAHSSPSSDAEAGRAGTEAASVPSSPVSTISASSLPVRHITCGVSAERRGRLSRVRPLSPAPTVAYIANRRRGVMPRGAVVCRRPLPHGGRGGGQLAGLDDD